MPTAGRAFLGVFLPIWVLLAVALWPASTLAQDRRFLTTPGIVVETGARACCL